MESTNALEIDLKEELKKEYQQRFEPVKNYRNRIWKLLTAEFFQAFVPVKSAVLDLGSGWGEFINHIVAEKKYGMDLNPDGASKLSSEVTFLNQDCAAKWQLPDESLDIVFTSNFFEHLPHKNDLKRTLLEAHRCLRRGGRLICMGPNVKFLPGSYWDFWDHYIPLTELSLKEALELSGYEIERCIPRFLPYTMADGQNPPLFLVSLYLKMPWVWRFFGKQFLVVAKRK